MIGTNKRFLGDLEERQSILGGPFDESDRRPDGGEDDSSQTDEHPQKQIHLVRRTGMIGTQGSA
jgi:hypothetical protein